MEKTTKQLIVEKLSILESSDDILIEGIRKFETSFFSSVKRLLSRFDLKNGVIDKDSKRNKKLISSLKKTLLNILNDSTYNAKIASYLKNFDRIKELNKLIHKGLSNIEIDKRVKLNDVQEEVVDKVLLGLTNKRVLEANLITPIRRILRRVASSGVSFKDAENELKGFIKGQIVNGNKAASQIERYVRTISFEAVNRFDGAIQNEIANEFEFDGIQIVGSLIKTSADQCIHMVNGIDNFKALHIRDGKYLYEDIDKIVGILETYTGTHDTLNESNYLELKNHWNCRHTIIPILLSRRDKEIAISKGLLAA